MQEEEVLMVHWVSVIVVSMAEAEKMEVVVVVPTSHDIV